MDREPKVFEAMAELVVQRLETERCPHAIVTTVRMDCRECMVQLVAESLVKIAIAATRNGSLP